MSEKIFQVELNRSVDKAVLGWPQRGEAMDESALGGNRSYYDLRGIRWKEVGEVLPKENGYLQRLLTGQISEDDLAEELWEAADAGEAPLNGLDPGVASVVFGLSAIGAVTAYSCNGGAFGNHHNSHHPVVAFYVRARMVSELLGCAERSNVGLENVASGMVIVYADRISAMHAFATELYRAKSVFGKLKRARQT